MLLDPQPTWTIYDSTKLQTMQTCPRLYFYQYVLGWSPESESHHLAFGSAIHKALEVIHTATVWDTSCIKLALSEFLKEWRGKGYSPEMDAMYFPKTPNSAMEMLVAYTDKYASDLERYKTEYVEISGTVPINEDGRIMHFRMDTLRLDLHTGLYESLEHKTAGGMWMFEKQWPLKVQVGTYTHVLHCLYPASRVGGVTINGLFFKKNKTNTIDLMRVPMHRTEAHVLAWLFTVNDLIDQIEYEHRRLEYDCSPDDPVMMCFPMNGESCTKYNGCPMHDFCSTWANPLAHIDRGPPIGYTTRHWNPAELDARTRMDLSTHTITTETAP